MRFYQKIGINIFSPSAGCSEMITSKIVHRTGLADSVLFCEADDGRPCYKCTKCLRKMLELNYHGHKVDFSTFNENYIRRFLSSRPLYFAHIFIETIKRGNNVPKYMVDSVRDIIHIDTDFLHRVYTKSFNYYPEAIKDEIISRLSAYADLMTEEDDKILENWGI